jgi:hypothetical protein
VTARNYSWEPFKSGHEVSMKHGAYSERRLSAAVEGLVQGLLELAAQPDGSIAYLRDPSYLPSVRAWARVEAQIGLVSKWLAEKTDGGLLDNAGEIRPAANLLVKLERQAETLRARLGLDPLSRARLGRDVAASSVDMAMLMARLDERDGEDEP